MTSRSRASAVFDERSHHAEGPLWSPGDRELIWVDQYRGTVRAGSPATGRVRIVADLGVRIGAIAPATAHEWIVAAGDGFAFLDRDGALTPVASVLPDDGVERRMNDGEVAPDGSFWAGSMATDKRAEAGSLYRLRHGAVDTMLTGLTISNGLAWSADAASLHFIDTPTGTVRRFRPAEDGTPRDPEVVVRIDPADGAPDGMCLDRGGRLWVAVWGAGEVRCYDAGGVLQHRVLVDAPQVSSCCFGGDDLSTLFITTSQEDYDDADRARWPDAGRIFAVETDAQGFVSRRYRG